MTTAPTILVVDDSPDTLEVLQRVLAAARYSVLTASSGPAALELLAARDVDLVVTDYRMPGMDGMELVRYLRENHVDLEMVMITGYASISGAVQAVKAGVDGYLSKPFTDEELLTVVDSALARQARRRLAHPDPNRLGASDECERFGIVGRSASMRSLCERIQRAARSDAAVLITGESGTGKELVARAIHYHSARAAAPFVPVNCGAIPSTLLASELFGSVKGAFTGATTSRAGYFQTAEGGTVFLDEVSETSAAMQVQLLRVVQEHELRMVGSDKPIKVDVRIVAATNRPLEALVARGVFRDDLYYRLHVLSLDVPPLRERADDVLELLRVMAARSAEEAGRPPVRFTDDALRALRRYEWPGNVRELENVVQGLLVMSDAEVLDVTDLPQAMRSSAPTSYGVDRTLAEVEADHIRHVLARVEGNKTRAAEILGIDRKTLREKLKRLDEVTD